MLIKLIDTGMEIFKNIDKKIRSKILLVGFLLIIPIPFQYRVFNDEFIYPNKTPLSLYTQPNTSIYKTLSPYQTIFISVSGTSIFTEKLKEETEKLRFRTREIFVGENDDISENYFMKLYVREDENTHVEIHPIRNFHPNSDLLAIAINIFSGKSYFSIQDLFYRKFQQEITLHTSLKDIEKLLKYIVYVMNIETYRCGLYYYVPFNRFYIDGRSFVPFMFFVFLVSFWYGEFHIGPFDTFLRTAGYFFCPISMFYSLFRQGNPNIIFIYSVINFKFGFIYSLIVYFMYIKKEFRKSHLDKI